MTAEVLTFLGGSPALLSLFDAAQEAILAAGPSKMAVAKTQISWGNPLKFAFLSLARRGMVSAGGAPNQPRLVFTLGLNRRAEERCIFQAVEPYPGRWTHHILLAHPDDVDQTVRALTAEAYQFAKDKKRRTIR